VKQAMQVLTSSQTAEWYTPAVYIEAVREVLGKIDLDPASCAVANEWIQAKTFYTEKDDGLSKPWGGNVFLNPPYGKTGARSNQDIWSTRLIYYHTMEYIPSAVLLTKSVPGYKWWNKLFSFHYFPVCFCDERIRFLKLDKHGNIVVEGQAKAGTNFWYLGSDLEKFEKVFSQFGRIV
jgi:ParB family chromosome partitioning protein